MDLATRQRHYWDSVAGRKEFTTPMRLDLFAPHVRRDSRVLDLGCGYGRTLTALHDAGYIELWGIDSSTAMIEQARLRCPYADVRVSDGAGLPFEDGFFDAIIVFAVLTCVVADSAQNGLMDEVHRVLRPGGHVLLNDYLLNDDARNLERYERCKTRYGVYGAFELPEGAVVRHHSEQRLNELTARFDCISREAVVFKTMNGNTSRGLTFLGRRS